MRYIRLGLMGWFFCCLLWDKKVNFFKKMEVLEYVYTQEELANALTHGIGVVLLLVLCPLLISLAAQSQDTRKIIGSVVFSFGLLAVYFSSTIFHSIPDKITKDVLHYFDLLSIYLLIAGSYTPFLLTYFRNKLGAFYLLTIWALSFLGIFFQLFFKGEAPIFSLILYLLMGWLAIFMIKPAFLKIRPLVLSLLLAGGLSYTLGTYFFYYDYIEYYHAIWHLFVLGGSLCHYAAVLISVKDKMR